MGNIVIRQVQGRPFVHRHRVLWEVHFPLVKPEGHLVDRLPLRGELRGAILTRQIQNCFAIWIDSLIRSLPPVEPIPLGCELVQVQLRLDSHRHPLRIHRPATMLARKESHSVVLLRESHPHVDHPIVALNNPRVGTKRLPARWATHLGHGQLRRLADSGHLHADGLPLLEQCTIIEPRPGLRIGHHHIAAQGAVLHLYGQRNPVRWYEACLYKDIPLLRHAVALPALVVYPVHLQQHSPIPRKCVG